MIATQSARSAATVLIGACAFLTTLAHAPPVCAAAPQADIPFRAASVRETGDRFLLRWKAPGVESVKVYCARSPALVPVGRPTAVGGPQGQVMLVLRGARRWYFELVPDKGHPLTLAPRSLHISAVNARDVGGYRTVSGAWVKMGEAYRSNELYGLTSGSIATLEALHVRTIVDLRTATERRRWPDAIIPRSAVVDADVLADDRQKLNAWLKPRSKRLHGRVNAMLVQLQEIYRDFVRLPSARSAYHSLFMRLANPADLPVLFHCTAGKDRTGWGQAVLLTILGVPRPVIERDYELSGYYLRASGSAFSRSIAAGISPAEARQMMDANSADLDAAFAEVQARYGNFDDYLRQGLALDDTTLAAIRRNFLVR